MNERFQPVKGREDTIASMSLVEGRIYFTTDTGKIYVDTMVPQGNNTEKLERVLMGNSGIALFYGFDPSPKQDEENESIFTLDLTSIENYENIHIDDLILNQDGCFYKITDIYQDDEIVECIRLSVSGSGGGGSGATTAIKIRGTSLEHSTLVNGQAATVNITVISATDEDGVPEDQRMTVVWAMRAEGANAPYLNGSFEVRNNVPQEFDIGSRLRENTHTILTFYASGVNSGQTKKTLQYDITTVDLTLTPNEKFNNLTMQSDANDVTFYCNVTGTIKKILYFKLDGEIIDTKILDTRTNGECYSTLRKNDSRLYHGYHTLEIELYSYDNDVQGMGPAPLVYEFPFKKIGYEYTSPIIWIGSYKDIYYSYDKIQIPYMVYDPMSPNDTHVEFYKGSEWLEAKSTSFDAERATSFKIFEINDATVDADNLYYIYCGDAARSITFTCVTDTSRDMNIIPTGLQFSLDAAGRSNNESATNRSKLYSVIKKTQNNIVTEVDTETYYNCFENFNWYNNGWILDNKNDTCLRISNGARLSIPIGIMNLNTQTDGSSSCTFEFEFKIRNISNYNKLIKEITRYKDDSNAFAAFEAQTAYDNYDAWLNAFDEFEIPDVDSQGVPTGSTHVEQLQNFIYYNVTLKDGELEFDRVYKKITLDSVCCSYYQNGIGLCLGPQDGFFSDGTDTVSVKYVEDKVMNLSIVFSYTKKLISIYLNGVLTGVSKITPADIVTINTSNIVFSSDYCDFDLYKFRVYNTDLSVADIDLNYAVDHKDILIYDQTKIALNNPNIKEYQFNYAQMLDYNENHPDDYLMPYVVLDTTGASLGDALPYAKITPTRNVKIEFVNTPLDRAYETGELNELADADGVSVAEYYAHHCPSFTSVGGDTMWSEMTVQGTSSEFYPRRNYKMKFKDDNDIVHMYMNRGPFVDKYNTVIPALEQDGSNQAEVDEAKATFEETHLTNGFFFNQYENGTNKFTMKIDYMESSGTYNMGFANFVTNAYTKHPLNDLNTAGAFEKANNELQVANSFVEGTSYVFVNYKGNLKVAADEGYEITAENFSQGPNFFITDPAKQLPPEDNKWQTSVTTYETTAIAHPEAYRTSVQGFPVMVFHKKSDGSYTFIGRYNMLLDKGSDECYGFKPPKTVLAAFNKHKTVRKTAECWEFEDNARGYCSFRDPLGRRTLSFSYPETNLESSLYYAGERGNSKVAWNPQTQQYDKHGCPIVADSFEYRYHTDKDLLDYLYDPTSMNETEVAEVQADYGSEGDLLDPTTRNNLLFKKYANWEKACQWVWSTCTDYVPTEAERLAGTKVAQRIQKAQKCADVAFDSNKTYYNDATCNYEAHVTPSAYDANANYFFDKNGLISIDSNEVNANNYINYFVAVDDTTYEANKFYELVDTTVTYNNIVYEYDTVEYRQAKFRNEFTQHFDLEYSLVYFIMTEIFECYDSRGKNCMMASWGPQTAGGEYIWYPIFYDIDTQLGINNTGIPSFEYYVNATAEGCYSTNDSVLWMNLFTCFRTEINAKYQQLRGKDGITNINTLEQTTPLIGKTVAGETSSQGLAKAIEHIEKWYLADPIECKQINMRGARPLIMLNLDEYYKYISIMNTNVRYQDRTGGLAVDSGGTYFYALQGDRSLSRQQFLMNRIEFMDSFFSWGDFDRGGEAIHGRIAANVPPSEGNNYHGISDNFVDNGTGGDYHGEYGTTFIDKGVEFVVSKYYQEDEFGNTLYDPITRRPLKNNYLDADIDIYLKPYQRVYTAIGGDNSATGSSTAYDGQNPIRMVLPGDVAKGRMTSANYGEQLFYIYGSQALQDIGDISLLYWAEFYAEKSPKLESILLGNDHPGFYNTALKLPALQASSADDPGKPMLKKVNLTKLTIDAGEGATVALDLTSSEKLQEFRALGSNLAGVTFADGVALNTLYLPQTITEIKLIEARKLTTIINDDSNVTPTIDNLSSWVPPQGLFVAGLTELTDAQLSTPAQYPININTLNIVGGSLGYNSYDLLRRLYISKTNSGTNLKINLTNVDWKPFTQLDEGYEYNVLESELYYKDNGHYQLVPYVYENRNSWELSILNKELYKKTAEIPDTITNFRMLKDLAEQQNFMNTNNFNNEIPTITGTIYINNTNGGFNRNAGTGRVEESFIKNTLQSWYPNLEFFFTNVEQAFSAKFVQIVDEETGELNILGTQKVSVSSYGNGSGTVWFEDPFETYNVEKNHYDFIGWKTYTLDGTPIIYLNKTAVEYAALDPVIKAGYITEYGEENIYTKEDWSDTSKSHFVSDNGNYVLDYTFYAMHEIHKHKITYKNIDNEETILQVDYIPYGDYLRTPDLYPSIDDSALAFDKTYAFIGFVQNKNATVPINLDKTLCTDDLVFYALYEERSVYENVLNNKYLTFTASNYSESTSGTSEYNIANGYTISIAQNVSLSGKITLPIYYDGGDDPEAAGPVIKITGFGGANGGANITHIFFERETDEHKHLVREYSVRAFAECASLRYVETPKTLRAIGAQALANCGKLAYGDFRGKVYSIGGFAFNQSFSNNSNDHVEVLLGGDLITVNAANPAFSYCSGTIESMTIGSPDNPSRLNTYFSSGQKFSEQNNNTPLRQVTIYYDGTPERESYFNNLVSLNVFGAPVDPINVNNI